MNRWGSEIRAKATIDLIVAETNQALRNTALSTRFRVVHMTSVEYAETGDSSVDLNRLRTPNDGFLDDLHGLRDLYAADLVALITDARDVCGQAFLGSPGRTDRYGFSPTCA